jgi:tetratricopeptide (TPR) repeat protein
MLPRAALALLLLASLALADVVHLKNGGKLEGRVREEGDQYVIETVTGTIKVKREDVLRIEKKDFTLPLPAKRRTRLAESYAHPFFGFKIYLPPRWLRGETHGKVSMSFYGPKDQAYIPRVDLIVERAKSDLGTIVGRFKGAFEKAYPDVKFVRDSAVAGPAGEGYLFVAEFNDGAIATNAMWTFYVSGDRAFIMSFTITKAWADRYLDVIEASMRSLRIYAEPKATIEQKQEFDREYRAAGEAYKKSDLDAAIRAYKRCAELLPEFAEAHAALATAYMKKANYADAEVALRKALAIDGDDYTFNYNMGVCALKQDKLDTAVAHLEKAVSADPNSEPALTNLGVAHLARDRVDAAIEALKRAVEADPESSTAHYNLGMAHEKKGSWKDAEREFKETLKIDAGHAGAKDGLARLKGK